MQCRLWWHGDEVHEYPVHQKLPTSSERWKSTCMWGTTVSHWTGLVTQPFIFFFTVFQEFVRFSNKDIEQIIKKEMSGDVKNAFFAIGKHYYLLFLLTHITSDGRHCWYSSPCLWFAVRSVKNQPSYFADRLYKAMKVLCLSLHVIVLGFILSKAQVLQKAGVTCCHMFILGICTVSVFVLMLAALNFIRNILFLRVLARMTERWSASWFLEVKSTFSTFVKSLKKHTMLLCMNSSR